MYFSEFPTIPYDAEGNGKFKDVKIYLGVWVLEQK